MRRDHSFLACIALLSNMADRDLAAIRRISSYLFTVTPTNADTEAARYIMQSNISPAVLSYTRTCN